MLENIQAAPELPVAQGPNAAAQVPNALAQGPNAAPAHVAAPEKAEAGNNQDAATVEPPLAQRRSSLCFTTRVRLWLRP